LSFPFTLILPMYPHLPLPCHHFPSYLIPCVTSNSSYTLLSFSSLSPIGSSTGNLHRACPPSLLLAYNALFTAPCTSYHASVVIWALYHVPQAMSYAGSYTPACFPSSKPPLLSIHSWIVDSTCISCQPHGQMGEPYLP